VTDQASNTNDPKKEIKINTPEPGALGASPYAAMEHPENIPDQSDALVVDTSDGTNTHVLDIDTELRGATGAVGFTVTPMPKPSAVQNPAVPIAPVQTLPPIAPPLPPLPIVVPPLAPFVRPPQNPAVPFVLVPPKIMPPPLAPIQTPIQTPLPPVSIPQAKAPVPPPPTPTISIPQPPLPTAVLKPFVPPQPPPFSLNPEVNHAVTTPPPPSLAPIPQAPTAPAQVPKTLIDQPRSFASITPLLMPAPTVPPPATPVTPSQAPTPQPLASIVAQPAITRIAPTSTPPVPISKPTTPPIAAPIQAPVTQQQSVAGALNENTPTQPPASPPADRPTPGMIAPILPNVRSDPKDRQRKSIMVPPPAPKEVVEPPPPPPPPVAKPAPQPPKPKVSPIDQLRALTSSPLHPLRTFRMDAEDSMKDQNSSLITMVAAEEKKRQTMEPIPIPQAPKHHYIRTFLLAIASVALLAGGVGAVAYVLIPQTVNPPPVVVTSQLVYVDESNELAIAGLDHKTLIDLMTSLRDKSGLALGLVREIYFTLPTSDGNKRLATIGEIMPRLAPNAPPELTRALDAGYLVGVHVFDQNQPFIMMKTSAYEQAYSSMLQWEPSMLSDLLPFMDRRLGPKLQRDIRPTSTPARVINSSFVDAIVQNHDARVLYDDAGDIILLYSFIERDTIVITTNDQTLFEVISRVSK